VTSKFSTGLAGLILWKRITVLKI